MMQADNIIQKIVNDTNAGFKIDKRKIYVSSVRILNQDEEDLFPPMV